MLLAVISWLAMAAAGVAVGLAVMALIGWASCLGVVAYCLGTFVTLRLTLRTIARWSAQLRP